MDMFNNFDSSYWQKYLVDFDFILGNKSNLLNFSNNLNDSTIRTMFVNYETDTEEYKMADHMSNRFKTFFNDPASFYCGCPSFQMLFSAKCGLNIDYCKCRYVMEFFKYIKCMIGRYDVKFMFGEEYLERFEKLTSIEFFFELTYNMQSSLVKKYNKTYDELLNK